MYLTVNMNGQEFDVVAQPENVLDEMGFYSVVILATDYNNEIDITQLCISGELHDSLVKQVEDKRGEL